MVRRAALVRESDTRHDRDRGRGALPACGGGTIVSVCLERDVPARGSDIVDRGFGEARDLFTITEPVDNIPYRITEPFARHMLKLARSKVALILPMTFFESRHYPSRPMWSRCGCGCVARRSHVDERNERT
jgi:hypothetical protein